MLHREQHDPVLTFILYGAPNTDTTLALPAGSEAKSIGQKS
jgi:hypothetical protein